MANKTLKLVEPNLADAILTLELWDDATQLGTVVGIATASNGVFTFTVSTAVNAKWYRVQIYEGVNLAYWGWVNFPNADTAGTYDIVSDKTAVEAVLALPPLDVDPGVE